MSTQVQLEYPADGVARLRWANHDRRNALNPSMLEAMLGLLGEAAGDPAVRVLILQGAGPWFCSGFDLSQLPASGSGGAIAAAELVEALMAKVEDFPRPVIAALRGPAMGAGGELAVAADLRIAADDLAFAMPPAKIGLVYHEAGFQRFLRLVGPARTREIFFTACRIDAARALACGLVDRITAADELETAAVAWASDMAALAPLSLTGAKRVLRILEGDSVDDAAQAEIVDIRRRAADSADHAEGLSALLQKRRPRFEGR